MDYSKALEAVEGFFAREKFSWAVIGAIGLHAYGLSRTTSDLERDLPTTPEDIAALRRLKTRPDLDFEQYLRFLSSFPPPSYEELRSRRGPHGEKPFELP